MFAAACAILIQHRFRTQASDIPFRRLQVASRASTLAETGASIACAGATALVAAGSALAVLPGVLLVIVHGDCVGGEAEGEGSLDGWRSR